MADYENIELRSEKVKNIIGKVPSELVRGGTVFITVILLLLTFIVYFAPCPESIRAKVTIVFAEGSEIYAEALIPYRYITLVKEGTNMQVEMEGYTANRFGYRSGIVTETKDSVIITNGNHYFRAMLKIDLPLRYIMRKDMEGTAHILVSDKSIVEHILDK